MKVRFDYYKATGKWYTSGEDNLVQLDNGHEFELLSVVYQMLELGTRPGLVDSEENEFFVIATPIHDDGETGVPRLFFPKWFEDMRKAVE